MEQQQQLPQAQLPSDTGVPQTPTLTDGEKAVGITFNPAGNPVVSEVKRKFADLIDQLNNLRSNAATQEAKRYYSKAISFAEDASMNAVRAITWQY